MAAQGVTINGLVADFADEVLRDAAGNVVALRPQTFAVLRHLAENPGRLVTKDELMQAVWPGIAVTDDSLVQCIHEIRRALNDEGHAVLKTVPRRGYRLALPERGGPLSPTAPEGPSPVSPAARRKDWRLAGGIALALAGAVAAGSWWLLAGQSVSTPAVPAIAVLPFENLGGDPAQSVFADGISEDLVTDLSKIPGLSVVARNSAAEYRDRPADVRTIARELGVHYVLEGSVQWQGDKVRVNAQLIDAAQGKHLWAERYDGPLEDIFAFNFQDKVIGRIISELSLKLASGDDAQTEPARPEIESYGTPIALHSGDELVIEARVKRSATWLEFGFDAAWSTVGTKLLRVNAADNSFAEIDINMSGYIRPPVTGEGAVWVQDIQRAVVIKVDPVTNLVVKEIPAVMLYHQSRLGTGEGSIWVVTADRGSDRMLTRFNSLTGALEAEIPLPSIGADVLVDFGSVWVAGVDGNAVYRIDPRTNAIVQRIAVHSSPKKVCSLDGSIWVLNSKDGFVDRIDGGTGQVTASINAGLVFPTDGDMACGGGYVWGHVAASHDSVRAIPSQPVVQIDPRTNDVIRRYIGGRGFGWDLRYGAGSLWMTGSALFRVKPPG